MSNDLVKRLLRVATYLHDIGENGYEVETVKEAAAYTKELEAALRKCHDALEVAFDYDDGDVFGIHHNDAVDAVTAAKNILGVE